MTDGGLDFCQLQFDIVRLACAIGEENGIYIILTGNPIDVSGTATPADVISNYLQIVHSI